MKNIIIKDVENDNLICQISEGHFTPEINESIIIDGIWYTIVKRAYEAHHTFPECYTISVIIYVKKD